MYLLLNLTLVFLSPLLLILLIQRSGPWFHYLADQLESWGWLRVLKALEHIGIVIVVVVFLWDLPVREETLKAFKEEREARAWSLIYQSKGSPGDGGRRYALEYLHNEKKANFAGLPLAKAHLGKVKLPRANLRKADLSEANLFKANLSAANLGEANLSKVFLGFANLRRAKLDEANLSGVNLIGADLSRADLSGANLSGAKLGGANLNEAYLNGANLSGANLSEVDNRAFGLEILGVNQDWNLTQRQIDTAFYCEQKSPPKLPAKLRLPSTRKCDKDGNPIQRLKRATLHYSQTVTPPHPAP